jgi:divalent metal cation (Fe/Co/Zn/Cd) transporter
VVSALIIKVGASFVWSATKEFIDTAPHKDVLREITGCAASVEGVKDVHDLRARTSGGKVFVQLHIVVDGEMPVRRGHDIAKEVEMCLIERVPHLSTAIVHVDPADEEITS